MIKSFNRTAKWPVIAFLGGSDLFAIVKKILEYQLLQNIVVMLHYVLTFFKINFACFVFLMFL